MVIPDRRASRRGHTERHRGERSGWLRAAVLGVDDGIVSVSSLAIGVIASGASRNGVLAAAIAALVAGAMSMAAGEYVSVSSQRDTERGDVAKERAELAADPKAETRELANIYRRRGLDPTLAHQVAATLMAHDALEAHARDELGLTDATARSTASGGAVIRGQLHSRGGASARGPGDRSGLDSHGHGDRDRDRRPRSPGRGRGESRRCFTPPSRHPRRRRRNTRHRCHCGHRSPFRRRDRLTSRFRRHLQTSRVFERESRTTQRR